MDRLFSQRAAIKRSLDGRRASHYIGGKGLSAEPVTSNTAMAITVYDILSAAAVSTRPYAAVPGAGIYLSDAGQLFGTYADLVRAQTLPQLGSASWPYRGWHRHHIVEFQDLDRLGVAARFPAYDRQVCVLIPQSAHVERVNSVLNYSNPQGVQVTPAALRSAYESAYSMLGDYCGGGEIQIRIELLSIVDAVFTLAGFAWAT